MGNRATGHGDPREPLGPEKTSHARAKSEASLRRHTFVRLANPRMEVLATVAERCPAPRTSVTANQSLPWMQGKIPCAQSLTKDMEGALPRSRPTRGFPTVDNSMLFGANASTVMPQIDLTKIRHVYLYIVTLDSIGGTIGMSAFLNTFLDEHLDRRAFRSARFRRPERPVFSAQSCLARQGCTPRRRRRHDP